jgi:osmotically-inducible protein OsmY
MEGIRSEERRDAGLGAQPVGSGANREHLSPPFYNAKDEGHAERRYPSEGTLSQYTPEDVGNYGRGGYYGNTYDQENISRARDLSKDDGHAARNTYRDLGDRRWPDISESSWEQERASRAGYSSIRERSERSGMHRGKGPKSYRRSDDRMLEDLNDRLYDDPYVNATGIETEVRDGEVILSGTVESKQAKRRAEDIAEMVSGVRNVENRLRITRQFQEGV